MESHWRSLARPTMPGVRQEGTFPAGMPPLLPSYRKGGRSSPKFAAISEADRPKFLQQILETTGLFFCIKPIFSEILFVDLGILCYFVIIISAFSSHESRCH